MIDPELAARLDRMELKLDLILESLGIRPDAAGSKSGFEAEARALLSAGRKIEAIKLWREKTGVGLREAKDAVEAL